MDDVFATKSRHGHYEGKSLWWMDHLMVDGKPVSIMVMFGSRIIGDKACYRIGNGTETFFEPATPQRDAIIVQGKILIRDILKERKVTARNGTPYDWQTPLPQA